jgi:hypothetical protein
MNARLLPFDRPRNWETLSTLIIDIALWQSRRRSLRLI